MVGNCYNLEHWMFLIVAYSRRDLEYNIHTHTIDKYGIDIIFFNAKKCDILRLVFLLPVFRGGERNTILYSRGGTNIGNIAKQILNMTSFAQYVHKKTNSYKRDWSVEMETPRSSLSPIQ